MSALVTLSTHTHTLVQTVTPAAWPGIGGEDFLSEQQKCLPLISVQRHWLNPFVSMSMPTNTSKSRWRQALVQISVDACRRVQIIADKVQIVSTLHKSLIINLFTTKSVECRQFAQLYLELLPMKRKHANGLKYQTQALMGATRLASGKDSAII